MNGESDERKRHRQAGTARLPVIEAKAHRTPSGGNDGPAVIQAVTSEWKWSDRLGSWKVRWGIGRMNYRVRPGLYALGEPGKEAPVLISASYKLSFDHLRRSMAGRSSWILVIDTDGVNVWCAAGKGSFGTDRILDSLHRTDLEKFVDHRRLIVPQLGAPGVAAHTVKEHSGFRVYFGPVRADDLPRFLDAGLKANPDMRRVRFTFRNRLALVPMELVPALRYGLPAMALLILAGGFGRWGYSLEAAWRGGLSLAAASAGALLAGAVATPLLLPWLPGRAFSLKGILPGLAWALFLVLRPGPILPWSEPLSGFDRLAMFFSLPALSALLAMNFTGSSTVTSLSGVKKEMRFALPLQIAGLVAGLIVWMTGHFRAGTP